MHHHWVEWVLMLLKFHLLLDFLHIELISSYFFTHSVTGRGGKKGAVEKCDKCRGTGVTVQMRPIGPGMVQQIKSACNTCNGQGEKINAKDRCKTCVGKKVIKERKILEIHIEKGKRSVDPVC